MNGRTVCWVSAGAASACAAALTPHAVLAYCETGSEHPDNERFLADVSSWLGRPIERLHSVEYADTWDVWERRRFLSNRYGAPCTVELKLAPRLAWQRPHDVHVFGYTADALDVERAALLREHFFELRIETPLIDKGITKESALAMIERAGIRLPPMYALGFKNNNCIPCVKATSPNYWALVRKEFPAEFARMSNLSRELGGRLCRIDNVRHFIDEIPADWPTTDPIQPRCDLLCAIAEQDLQPAQESGEGSE